MSEYTDAQVGRIIDHLEQTGQLDNTVVFYCADNGASGEGSPSGSVNENKFFNNYPDDLKENLKYLETLGSPATYNHYPTGWAAAFSAPFKMFKRYSHAGGTCCPMVVHWPKGIKAKGELRHQYHHSVDVVPTILGCAGVEMPKTYRGVEQWPLSGVSMKYTFDAGPDAPTQKHKQYYAMLGTRGYWEDGWKIVAVHAALVGKGHFDQDPWELYHVSEDRAESKNLAREQPEKLRQMIKGWFAEAEKNLVLPLDDRTPAEILGEPRPSDEPARDRYTYYPNTAPVPGGRGQRPRAVLQDSRHRRDHRPERLGRDLRPRVAGRRPRPIPQGSEAALRLQLPRHQARAALRLVRGAEVGQVRPGHGVRPRGRAHPGPPAARRAGPRQTVRPPPASGSLRRASRRRPDGRTRR